VTMGGDGHSQTRIQCRDDRVFIYVSGGINAARSQTW